MFAPAIWHIQQSDSSARSGAGYANLRTCTSKRAEFSYQLLKIKCAKYQKTNDYWRVVRPLEIPIIKTASARGYDSAVFTLSATNQTTDAPIAYYLITNIKTGQIDKVSPNNYGEISLSNLSPLTSYTFTIAAVSVDGTSPFSSITPEIKTGAVPVERPVERFAPATCANGGTCIVGDRGPGGGIVFYYSADGFACGPNHTETASATGGKCKWLEVARSGWDSKSGDPELSWAKSTYAAMDVEGVANVDSENINDSSGVGLGYKNSIAIVNQGNDTTTAAGAARAYTGGSKNDWYLPTSAELNLLCQWQGGIAPSVTTACTGGTLNSATYGAGSGGFVGYYYWSSSEIAASPAWAQYLSNGYQLNANKNNTNYVRPVRAF